MANILIINRIEEGLFTHTLTADGETQTAIDNSPNLTSFWINGVRVMDFKTKNGAPLVRNQRILPSEITITDSFGSTPPQTGFTNDVQVWNALGALGYFQGFSGGSGGGGVDSFINLTDVNPNLYLGFEGMVYVVNETATGLEPVIFYNYNNLTQLEDVEIDSLVPSDTGKYVAVSMVGGQPKFTLVTLPNSGNDLPNGFTNLGTQSLVDGEYTATIGYEWNYQNIHYGLVDDFTTTINPAGEGNSRIDVIHTVPGTNEFAKTEGIVSAGQNTALKPAIPVGALEVTILSIYEDSISEPNEPIIGEEFVTKSSYGWSVKNISGEDQSIVYQNDSNAFELTNSALVSIGGVQIGEENTYDGQPVWILNSTGNSITILNDAPQVGLIERKPFIFPEGQDMNIADNGLVRFKRKGNEMLFEGYSIGGAGDYIPRSGTVEGQPITGALEFEPYTETGLFSKDNDSDITFTLDLGSDLDGSGSGFRREDSGVSSSLLMTSSGTYLNSSNPDYQGFVGQAYYDKQGNPNAYAQMQDVKFILSNEDLSLAKRKDDVLYGILDQFTGEEITLSKIDSIPTGNSVDEIIYFKLGTEFFKRVFNQYNIQWFGAKPDGSDCTDAIQACINSCFYAGGGEIVTPYGIHILSGPLKTSDNKGNNPNSQLYIPGKEDLAVGGTDTVISIKFIGIGTPTMNASGFVDDKIAEINQGCMWKSTLPLSEATGVLPSVIGSKGDNENYNFNVIDVMFEDMWIRTRHDATVGTYMTAFNMLDVAFSTFERCRADIDVAGFNSVEHQNLCIGIAPTKSNGGTTVVANNCTSYGYKIGYTVGEHAYYTNLNANFCVYAYDVSKAGHASMIVKALTQWNKHAMSFNMYDNEYGDEDPLYIPANFIAINEFVVEAINNGKWYVSTVDIIDPTNGIKGNCFFTKTVSGQGVFANTKLIKTGGLNMNDKHITRPIVVLEDDVERTYLKLRNPYPTSGTSFGAMDIYGGNSINESTKFQIGQVSDGTAAINNLANKPLIITVNGKSLTLLPNGNATLEGTLAILNATASNHAVALNQVVSNTNTSASTLTLTTPSRTNYYQHTGTGSTWTLPDATTNVMNRIICTHKGSGTLTINSLANQIWESGTPSSTYSASVGESVNLYSDGVNWIVL